MLQRNLKAQSSIKPLPFITAFQKRLLIYHHLQKALHYDRKLSANAESKRELVDAALNSRAFPELVALNAINSFGLSMLKLVPNIIGSVNLQPRENTISALQILCESFLSISNEAFFSSWSPKRKLPHHKLHITPSMLSASSGDASKLVDGSSLTAWICSGGYVDITFEKPTAVSFLSISWVPTNTSVEFINDKLGAPDWFSIFIKDGNSQKYVELATYHPDVEKVSQGTWTQVYSISRQDISSIRLVLCRTLSKQSTLSKCTMYDLSAHITDDVIQQVDTLQIIKTTQDSLLNLAADVGIANTAFTLRAILSLLRGAASLKLILDFVSFMSVKTSNSMEEFSKLGLSAELGQLLDAIRSCAAAKREEFNRKFCAAADQLENVKFDETSLTDGVCLSESGQTVSCTAAGGYSFISQPFDHGVFEWELELVDVTNISIGVAVTGTKGDVKSLMSQSWLYNCGSGVLKAKNEVVGTVRSAEPSHHCILSYNASSRFLSLQINGENLGVIFDEVPDKVSPVVVFEEAVNIDLRDVNLIRLSKSASTQRRTHFLLSSKECDQGDVTSVSDQILSAIHNLSLVHIAWIESKSQSEKYSSEQPFCAEVSIEIIEQVSDLVLESVHSRRTVFSLLGILDLQFMIMSSSNLSLIDTANGPQKEVSALADQLPNCLRLKQLLLDFVKSEDTNVKLQAMKTFCRGIDVFLPTVEERIATVTTMLVGWIPSNAAQDRGKHLILQMILERVCSTKHISDLFSNLAVKSTTTHVSFIDALLSMLSAEEENRLGRNLLDDKSETVSLATATISKIAEEIVYIFTCKDSIQQDSSEQISIHDDAGIIFKSLFKKLSSCCVSLLSCVHKNNGIDEHARDCFVRKSFVGRAFQPMIYALSMPAFPTSLLVECVACLTTLSESLSPIVASFQICSDARKLLALTVSGPQVGTSQMHGSGGWRPIKAFFDDADNSFTIGEQGMTFTSSHSTNTCALVNTSFGPGQRAAWEFSLEQDSMSDECSVFGAARKPLTSRCYSSSQDLWMRRAYNGYMYAQGASTGQPMDKIHPGDVVRVEFDGDKGTLAFSVNGSEPEVGFSDIRDEIYPACGSYRNNVVIKLLKVEVFHTGGGDGADESIQETRPTSDIFWKAASSDIIIQSNVDGAIFVHPLSREKVKSAKMGKKWITARGSRGCSFGVHEWAVEFVDAPDGAFAVGAVVGDFSSTLCLSDQSPATAKGLKVALAWLSNGSLWLNGRKVGDDYGVSMFPLKQNSVIRMRVNVQEGSVSFNVNGVSLGVAFHAKTIGMPILRTLLSDQQLLFPAASMQRSGTKLRLKSVGLNGSTILPFCSSLLYSTACVVGQTSLRLMKHPSIEPEEEKLLPWLESPLFIAGLGEEIDLMHKIGLLDKSSHASLSANLKHFKFEKSADQVFESQLLPLVEFSGKDLLNSDAVGLFLNWLESQDPEPQQLRKILERSGTYRFLSCELPYIACLIKQSRLQKEFYSVCTELLSSPSDPPVCSADMFLVWQKTKQLRSYLRMQRQKLNSINLHETEGPTEDNEIPALSSSPRKPDSEQVVISRVTSESHPKLATKVDWFSEYSSSVFWIVEEAITTKLNTPDMTVIVHRVGLDTSKSSIVIDLEFKLDGKPTDLPSSFPKALLVVNGVNYTDLVFLPCRRQQSRMQGTLLCDNIDVSLLQQNVSQLEQCALYLEGEGTTKIDFSAKKPAIANEDNTSSFEKLCNKIRKKAQFLFFLNVSDLSSPNTTRSKLIGLSSMYSRSSGSLRSKANDVSRWKAQDRWRRVVEFLHVQITIKKQTSIGSTSEDVDSHTMQRQLSSNSVQDDDEVMGNGNVSSADIISNAQATIQACGVFITSEDLEWSADSLARMIARRLQRAQHRIKTLKTVNGFLSSEANSSDPFLPFAVTSYLQNAFTTAATGTKKKTNGPDNMAKSHYLTSLEGCPSLVLKEVQDAFSSVYKQLTKLFTNLVMTWDDPNHRFSRSYDQSLLDGRSSSSSQLSVETNSVIFPITVIVRMWLVHFSGRDIDWIHESGILPILHKVSSLQFHEKHAFEWRSAAKRLLNAHASLTKPLSDPGSATLWPQKAIENGLLSGSLRGREILMNSIMVAKTRFTEEERIGVLDAATVTRFEDPLWLDSYANTTYCSAMRIWKKKMDDAEAKSKKSKPEIAPEVLRRGMFDVTRHGPRITLSEDNLVASLIGNNDRSAMMAFGNYMLKRDTVDTLGNYFEITILSLANRDIGVGLSTSEVSVTQQMPGWKKHSYGYHGDDGKKFGEGKTPGDWPLYELDDVIGCGINFETDSIFFTRNGLLLGTAFENVSEDGLYPVVGFSNRNTETATVKINFGLEPFAYNGPEVRANTHAVTERVVRDAERALKALSVEEELLKSGNAVVSEDSLSSEASLEKAKLETYTACLAEFRVRDQKLSEIQRLRSLSNSLVRYLLFTFTKLGQDRDMHLSSECSEEVLEKPTLVKDVSTYGTPTVETSFSALQAQSSLIAALCHEVAVGAEYLKQFDEIGSRKSVSEIETELLCGLSPQKDGSSSNIVLEPNEVDHFIQSELLNFAVLCSCSYNAKSDLSHLRALKTFLRLLECNGSACQLTTLGLLRSILPSLDPVRVEEATSAESIHTLDMLDAAIDQHDGRRKVRRLPDYFIRALMLDASRMFGFEGEKKTSSHFKSEDLYPFGYGSQESVTAHAKVKLLQTLFEAPLWTEVIAYNILHAFKNAEYFLKEDKLQPETGRTLCLLACVACSCLNAISAPLPGSVVETNVGAQFYLVSGAPMSPQVSVVQVEHVKDFSFSKHIEMVTRDKLTAVHSHVAVDFAKLSQPVLTQLLSMARTVGDWLCVFPSNSPDGINTKDLRIEEKLRLRLGCFAFTAISTLLASQPDVLIDSIHEMNILSQIGSLASLVLPIGRISNFSELQDLWLFSQERCLEGQQQQGSLTVRKVPKPLLGSATATAVECSDDQVIITDATSVFEISRSARESRMEIVRSFAEAKAISEDLAQRVLEYSHMNAVDAARMLPMFIEQPGSVTWLAQQTKESQEHTSTIADENLLRGIEFATTKISDVPYTDTPGAYLLEEVSPVNEGDLPFYVVISNEEGKWQCDCESVGTCRKILDGSEAIVEFVAPGRCVSFQRLLPLSQLRRIKEWFFLPAKQLASNASSIDLALCIMSVRNIVNRLLRSGGIASSQMFSDKDVGLSLVKLVTSTSKASTSESLMAMVEGFAVPSGEPSALPVGESDQGELELVQGIVEDAEKMLDGICKSAVIRRPDEDASASSQQFNGGFRVTSPHPFVAPCNVVGKIIVPKSWSGATVRFHPKSQTPSPKAALSFYLSDEELAENTPHFVFSGSTFSEFPVTSGTSLFYRFQAEYASDRSPLEMSVIIGDAEAKTGEWSLKKKSETAVGLGEDDNLFNLFDSGHDVVNSASGVMVTDCRWIDGGIWWYEVEILEINERDETIGAVGFATEAFIAHPVTDFSAVHGSCFVTSVNREINNEGTAELGLEPWKRGDTICLVLEITAGDHPTTRIHYCLNGIWNTLRSIPFVAPGFKPVVILAGSMRAKINHGERPLASQGVLNVIGATSDDSDVKVVRSVHENRSEDKRLEAAWGYDFVVQPVVDLDLILTNEFDLIWSSKIEDTGVTKPGEASKKFWVWRGKAKRNYLPVADIITTTPSPPARTILLNKSQAKHPTSYSCVFFSSKASIAVWRPKPPGRDEYVCLGDVVNSSSSASNPPSTTAILCVPKWATKVCDAVHRVTTFKKLGDGKLSTNPTIWRMDNHFGFFFGSPYEKRKSDSPRSADFKVDGVGEGYTLLLDISASVLAQWTTETAIASQPSLTWAYSVFHGLLQSTKWHRLVLTDSVFKSIVRYMKTCTAAFPIKLVPILIQMVRRAQQEGISLPLDEVKSLCAVVLNEAITMIQTHKKAEVPKSLMSLVDLVVEIQSIHVAESGRKDRSSRTKAVMMMRMQREYAESKEEDENNIIEEKTGEFADQDNRREGRTPVVPSSAMKAPWWERKHLDPLEVKVHRVIRKDNLEGIFSKDTVLLKLKQALKFLHAIGKQDIAGGDELVERSYPKLMTTRIWYEFASRCAFLESFHPYRERKVTRTIHFPGVQHLAVALDKRFALCPGDKLTIAVPGGQSITLSGTESEATLKKEIQFISDELLVTFEADPTKPVNESREWGWALLVAASGSVYETATVSLNLNKEVERSLAEPFVDLSVGQALLERQRSAAGGGVVGGYGSDSDTGSEESGPTAPLDVPFVCKPPLYRIRPEDRIHLQASGATTVDASVSVTGEMYDEEVDVESVTASTPRPHSAHGKPRVVSSLEVRSFDVLIVTQRIYSIFLHDLDVRRY